MRLGICTTSWMLPKTLRMRFFAPELRCAGWAALVAMLYLPCSHFFPPLSGIAAASRSDAPTSEPQSLMRISYAVFCLHKNSHLRHTAHTYTHNTRTIIKKHTT